MTKETKSAIKVEDNTNAAQAPAAALEVERYEATAGIMVETYLGVQSGVNFAGAEPDAEAGVE